MKSLRPFSALTHRNYRLFWFGQIISLTGTWVHQTAQGWLVYELTSSPFFLGLTGTAASAPILLFTLPGGVIADRHPKRSIILVSHIVLMVLALILTILVATETVLVIHVLILAFLIGTVHAFEIPARQSFIIELVGKEDLMNGIALNSSAFHGARMVGPTIASIIMATLGMAVCFLINTFSFLAIIIALLSMSFRSTDRKKSARQGMRKELKEGLRYIRSSPTVSTLILSVGIISFFGFPYVSFLPVYARDILQTGSSGLGILMSCAGGGAFTGAVILAIKGDTKRKGLIMAAAGLTFSTALLIFSLSSQLWISYTMLFLVGLGAINQIATVNSLLQLSVPDELRGRVMSSFTTMFLGMAPLGNFVVGSLAQLVGTRSALTAAAGMCLLGSLAILLRKPEIITIRS